MMVFTEDRSRKTELKEAKLARDQIGLHRALGAHHGDLLSRPGLVHVGADFLRCHDVEGAAIGLAGDDGDERHRASRIRRTAVSRRA